jgi:hypothetical protein
MSVGMQPVLARQDWFRESNKSRDYKDRTDDSNRLHGLLLMIVKNEKLSLSR